MKTVVLIDDDPDDHFFFSEALKEVMPEAKCEYFSSGKSAVDLICVKEKVHPDLVFLDINMPELNGLEVAERLVKCFPTLPIVVCSTAITESHRAAFAKMNVTRLEKKAGNFKGLISIVEKYANEILKG